MTGAEWFREAKYISKKPEEKFRIAVMYQVASYWPSIESFYQACRKDPDVDIRIFYIDDMSVERAQVENSEQFLQKKEIPFSIYSEEEIKQFSPHAALYQPPYDTAYRNPSALSLHLKNMGVRILYIPYGIEIADTEDAHYNHFFPYVVRNCWRIYTFSERMKADYERYCPNRRAVRALGIPKFDSLYFKDIPANEEMLRRARGRKIVLWKLHFPKLIYDGITRIQVTPDLSEYLTFAQAVERYRDLFFVVMPHPMFFSQTIDKRLADDGEKLFQQLGKSENVMIERGADYREVLYHADAIIIDRSALMVEAGLCGVPVLYMKNKDYEEPLTDAVKPLVNAYAQGTVARDMELFVDEFRGGMLRPLTERIQAAKETSIPFVDGKCGKRILADIKKGIEAPAPEAVRVVLFGAGFICEHYLTELGLRNAPDVCILGISDNDPLKWGTYLGGVEIIPPEKLKQIEFDFLVIMSEQFYMPIKKKLVYELFLPEEAILRLDTFAELCLGE